MTPDALGLMDTPSIKRQTSIAPRQGYRSKQESDQTRDPQAAQGSIERRQAFASTQRARLRHAK